MRRLEVVFSRDALLDLQDIYIWIAASGNGPITAERYTRRIEERCLEIGDAPDVGRSRDDLFPGLKLLAFERRATIAYRTLEGVVEILNIFGTGRDYEAFYGDDDERG